MKVLLALLLVCLWSAGAKAQTWSNAPAGLTTVTDCPFSNALCPGWQNVYNTQAYASFPNAPLSPSSVFDTYLAANSTTGNGQWALPFQSAREVFLGTWWRQNADFEGFAPFANKLLFVMNDGGDANFLNWIQYGGKNTPGTLTWVFQAKDGSNNCHVAGYSSPGCSNPAGGPGTGNLLPNVSSAGTVAAGSGWHKLELYIKASTTTTSQDGIFRLWVDGVKTTDYVNLNISTNGINRVEINHTWDGTSALNCSNRDCSKAWHHYWDHLIVAASFSGGGTTPPPPPPPSVNPGTVGDLSATAVNTTRASVQFTAVSDGTGNPAKYDIRSGRDVMSWGAAQSVSQGTCTVPFAPGVMSQMVTCNIDGLTPGYTYKIQMVAFRGTMGLDAVYGSLSNVATVTMQAETPPPNPPTPPSPPPGISAPSNLSLLAADTYRITKGSDIWELRGASAPFVLYKNGVCGACDVVGYSLIFSQELNTIGLEFQPGKHQYIDTQLNEWVVISGTILGLTGASVTGSFTYAGTIPAGFNVYWSASPGGTKVRLPLYTGVWDRGFHDPQHSVGCYEVRGYDGTGIEGPSTPEVCTASGPGSVRDIGQITPRKVIDFAGAVWELQGASAPYVMYKDGVCECTLAGYSLRYKTGVVEMEYLPGKWVRRDATLNEWVITEP